VRLQKLPLHSSGKGGEAVNNLSVQVDCRLLVSRQAMTVLSRAGKIAPPPPERICDSSTH